MPIRKVLFTSFATLLFAVAAVTHSAHAGVPIYDSTPAPLPPNIPSVGYQATQTAEFGDLIQFGGTGRTLTQITLVMSDWALASTYGSSSPTWNHPITLTLYNVDNSGANPAPGTIIATQTNTYAIPWRPEADPTCPPPSTAWKAPNGNCYNGYAFTITFDFTGTTVPEQIIYGVAYNTNTWGYAPIGVSGPYESLNFGLAQVPPTTGSNPFPDTAYVASGAAPVFARDTGWTPYSGAIRFDVPGAPAVLQGAVSRKVHGAAGTFNLPLAATPLNPSTEPRIGPAQTVVFTFDKPIASATAAVTEGTATAAAPAFSGNDVIVALTGVANAQYVTVLLTNIVPVDGGAPGTASIRAGFLLGDVNQNRVVTVSDVGQVNAQLAQFVTAANFIDDINASGTLTITDRAIANANLTNTLPAP